MNDDTKQESDLPLSNGIAAEERLFMELSWDLGTARMAYEQMLKVERGSSNDDLDAELEGIGADKRMGDALERLSNRALELRNRILPEARTQEAPGLPTRCGPETQEGSWRSVIVGNADTDRML